MNTIGQYELGDMIGQGGMGTVYKARDSRFDRTVAIKVLHSLFASDPQVVERFKSEAVIQAKLSHPNIVTVHDFIVDGKLLAIVMEYVTGSALSEVISHNNGPLPPELVGEIGRQVCWALDHAHAVGLVHRDIKPSNILLVKYRSRLHVKLMDFGVAKILGGDKLRTATAAKMGTLAYMSPEQLRSPKSVDHRADIYSAGVTLYEALTGRTPFDADTEYELMRQIIERPVDSEALKHFGQLGKAVLQALSKEPATRWQSATDFENALCAQVAAPLPMQAEFDEDRTSQSRILDSQSLSETVPSANTGPNDIEWLLILVGKWICIIVGIVWLVVFIVVPKL